MMTVFLHHKIDNRFAGR